MSQRLNRRAITPPQDLPNLTPPTNSTLGQIRGFLPSPTTKVERDTAEELETKLQAACSLKKTTRPDEKSTPVSLPPTRKMSSRELAEQDRAEQDQADATPVSVRSPPTPTRTPSRAGSATPSRTPRKSGPPTPARSTLRTPIPVALPEEESEEEVVISKAKPNKGTVSKTASQAANQTASQARPQPTKRSPRASPSLVRQDKDEAEEEVVPPVKHRTAPTPTRISTAREEEVVTPEESVEEQLAQLGYKVNSKLFVASPADNMLEAKYLEAITETGYPVFIELDVQGYVKKNGQNNFVQGDLKGQIPESLRRGHIERHHNVCAIALVCQNGICITEKIGAAPPSEMTFIPEKPESFPIRQNSILNNVIAYPAVKMTEIQQVNDSIQEIIAEVSNSIRMEEARKSRKSFQALIQSTSSLLDHLDEFAQLKEEAEGRLVDSINELQEALDMYNDLETPLAEDQLMNREEVVYNLKIRRQMLIDLNQMESQLTQKAAKIETLDLQVDEACQILIDRFNEEEINSVVEM